MVYILIMFLSTSPSDPSGAASISQEFTSQETCRIAGASLAKSAHEKQNYVLSWGCFQK